MGLLNGRVFSLIIIFSFIETLMYYVKMFLPTVLSEGATGHVTAIFVWIFNAYSFLLSFVLFFIVFYRACGKIIQEEPASVIITLIVGGFVGTWIGGLAAVPILTKLRVKNFDLAASLMQLPISMQSTFAGNFLFATAAMLWSWFVQKWNEKLTETSFQTSAVPFDIALVSALFVFSGILSLFVLPLIGIALSILDAEWSLLLLAALTPLMLVNAGAQIAIAVGLYRGKRWGWLLAFMVSLVGICININLAVTYLQDYQRSALTIVALLLNVTTAILLLTQGSRQHCRITNPQKLPTSRSMKAY